MEEERKAFNARPVQFDDLNEIFDEKGSMFLALRRIQWCNNNTEPDRSKSKLELRKWMVGENGEEKANKGFAFLTEDGPHELSHILVKNGFGKTKTILKELKKRDDFKESVENLYNEESDDSDEEDFFDMRSALLQEEPEDAE